MKRRREAGGGADVSAAGGAGDYAALFSSEMVNALSEGRRFGLQTEIGMMRVAMLRLMLEEENPSRMAHGLAKLSGALGKSIRTTGGMGQGGSAGAELPAVSRGSEDGGAGGG
ncbi:MAG: hypothetical protein R2848_00125 [Thermomicrobiales bacterium]